MRVWVVGSGGMLGRALTALLSDRQIPYVGTDRMECDITDLEAVLACARAERPTHIVNCAAYTDVDRAESEPLLSNQINGEGPGHLARAASEGGARFVHISTDYVFDGMGTRPLKEDDPCGPINVYGQSKLLGEERALLAAPGACIIRTSWLFGRGGKNFLSQLVQWLETKEELSIVSDQINRPTYVPDLAEAIINLLDAEGVYHFANGHPLSRYEMAKDVLALRKMTCRRLIPVKLESFPSVACRPLYTALDTTKVSCELGREPRSWKEVLIDYLESELYVC